MQAPRVRGLMKITGLVPRHTGFDFDCPLVNSAGHALGLFEALLAEPLDDAHAAAAVVAVNDEVFAAEGFEFAGSLGELAHWKERRGFDVNERVFIGFAAIDEGKVVRGVELLLYGLAGDFEWEGRGHAVWSVIRFVGCSMNGRSDDYAVRSGNWFLSGRRGMGLFGWLVFGRLA